MTDQDLVARLRTDVLWLERRSIGVLPNDLREAIEAIERLTAEVAELKAYATELALNLPDYD